MGKWRIEPRRHGSVGQARAREVESILGREDGSRASADRPGWRAIAVQRRPSANDRGGAGIYRRVYVGRRFAHRDPELEPTWRLFREAMEIPLLRKSFVVNGWADCLTRESFSLSARGALHARVWIWASETKAVVWTTVPSRWYGNDSRERKRLRAAFLDALPVDVDRSEVWPEWTFKMPEERKEAIQCIADVAEAIQSVLVPAADAAIV